MNEQTFWIIIGGLVFWTVCTGAFCWHCGVREERGREREEPADVANQRYPRFQAGYETGFLAAMYRVDARWVMQDSRQIIGNAVLWHRKGGGYTTHIEEAEVFTREAAMVMHGDRATDIPWPLAYATARQALTVDATSLDKKEAADMTEAFPWRQ